GAWAHEPGSHRLAVISPGCGPVPIRADPDNRHSLYPLPGDHGQLDPFLEPRGAPQLCAGGPRYVRALLQSHRQSLCRAAVRLYFRALAIHDDASWRTLEHCRNMADPVLHAVFTAV